MKDTNNHRSSFPFSSSHEEEIVLTTFEDDRTTTKTTTSSSSATKADDSDTKKNVIVDVELSLRERFDYADHHDDATTTTTTTKKKARRLRGNDILDPNQHPFIQKVYMSIASHPTVPYQSSPIDRYIVHSKKSSSSSSSSSPPGFSITIEPIDDIPSSYQMERDAVQRLVYDWIEKRILVTPLIGSTWDVIVVDETDKKRKYQILLPFDGSAWSADALTQSFQATLVSSQSSSTNEPYCHVKTLSSPPPPPPTTNITTFFGWSSYEWSQLLVGEGAPLPTSSNNGKNIMTPRSSSSSSSMLFYPVYKHMWWSVTRMTQHDKDIDDDDDDEYHDDGSTSVQVEFGIRYQSQLPPIVDDDVVLSKKKKSPPVLSPSSWKSWIPTAFWNVSKTTESSSILCSHFNTMYDRRKITIVTPYESSNHTAVVVGDDDDRSDSVSSSPLKVGETTTSGPLSVKVISLNDLVNDNDNEGGERRVQKSAPTTTMMTQPITIHQVLRRHSNNHGRFESYISINSSSLPSLSLTTDHIDETCELTYRQILPHFMTPMWRSLRIMAEDVETSTTTVVWTSLTGPEKNSSSSSKNNNNTNIHAYVEWNEVYGGSVLYVQVPQIDNTDSNVASSSSSTSSSSPVPSSIIVSMEYEPSFLTLDDFPGDPNRGQVLPPGKVTKRCRTLINNGGDQQQQQQQWGETTTTTTSTDYYSNALLLIPPVPDLSMPFNVISLTSSLYAYIIGTLITILVRKGTERIKYKLYPDKIPESTLSKLKKKIRTKLSFLSRKKQTEDKTKEE